MVSSSRDCPVTATDCSRRLNFSRIGLIPFLVGVLALSTNTKSLSHIIFWVQLSKISFYLVAVLDRNFNSFKKLNDQCKKFSDSHLEQSYSNNDNSNNYKIGRNYIFSNQTRPNLKKKLFDYDCLNRLFEPIVWKIRTIGSPYLKYQ